MAGRKQKNVSGKSKNISRSKIGKRNKQRGNSYERKLINELKEITGNENLCSSRADSKNLDNMKIDISDPDNVLSFYVQAKATQAVPQIKKINAEVGLKDKPLVIFWNAQEPREHNQISVGEYTILSKEFFYDLIKLLYK